MTAKCAVSDWRVWRGQTMVTCPECGDSGPIDDTHTVAPDGEVSPSLVCDCGFHEFIQLEGWGR